MWPCCLSHFFNEKKLVCKVTSKERVGFVTCSEEEAPGGQWCKATLTSTICSKGCSQRFHTGLPWARMEHLLWRLPQWQCWEGNCLSESLAASPESGEGIPCIQNFSYFMSFHKQTKPLPICGPTSSIYQRRRQFALMFFFIEHCPPALAIALHPELCILPLCVSFILCFPDRHCLGIWHMEDNLGFAVFLKGTWVLHCSGSPCCRCQWLWGTWCTIQR